MSRWGVSPSRIFVVVFGSGTNLITDFTGVTSQSRTSDSGNESILLREPIGTSP